MHSDTQAQCLAQQYVTATMKDLDAVRATLEAHGDTLLKRWVRKSVEKRAALVRKAIPESYDRDFAHVRMDFDTRRVISGAMPMGSGSMTLQDTDKVRDALKDKVRDALKDNEHPDQYRNVNIVPYLDVQTLSEDPSNLLSILHHRSGSTAANWAPFDFEHTCFAFNHIMLYNPHCVIMYGKHYGKLIAWNKDSAHRHDICGYPRAILVLEAQSILASSLRSIVDLILATGIEDAAKGRMQWDLLANSDFQYRQASGTLSRRLSAYRSLPTYDMTAIVGVLTERLEAITDELTQFQIDPLLFRAHLSQIYGAAVFDTVSETTKARATIAATLSYVTWQWFFRTAISLAKCVRLEQKAHTTQIRVGRSSPVEYDSALVELRKFLTDFFEGQLIDLHALQALCNNFQQHQTFVDGTTRVHMSDGDLYKDNLLLWNFEHIRDTCEMTISPSCHLDWINKLISGRAGADSVRVDDIVAMHVANMTAVDDVLSALKYHRPQPETADEKDVQESQIQWAGLETAYPGDE
ncbi:hypothetical protein LTS10_012211 [Elasticomyces elasticus]|nr:hypothetical protein LTS10_012211 [Elasticomyces elasticus]